MASTFEVAVVAGRLAGRVSVRHGLTRVLLERGGHVGYCVLPAFRRRGVGRALMQRGLEIARQLDVGPVLVTCDGDNIASRKIIEQAGGKYTPRSGQDPGVRHYWFEAR